MSKYQQINHHIQKVINSQCFTKSVVLKELFKLLVEQSVKGEELKELEIAYQIFGKHNKSDKEKNIRIYVFNLRKKLKEYYEKEGSNDVILFSIPKGGYEVKITTNRKLYFRSQMARFSPYILGLSIALLVVAALLFQSGARHELTRKYIWKDIYKSEYPLLMVLGDHYFVNQRNVFGRMSATRFTDINTDSDFDRMISQSPQTEKDLQKTGQTYINRQGPFAMYKIMEFLGGGKPTINMRYVSNLEWEHVKNTNTIFIGSYKTQLILKQVFERVGIAYQVNGSKLKYTVNDSTLTYQSRGEEFLNREFVSFTHFKTSDGRIVMSLMCNSDVGNIGAVKYLSIPENLDKLKQLTKKFGHDNFKAVFEVRGNELTDFEMALKRIDPITADIDELWP